MKIRTILFKPILYLLPAITLCLAAFPVSARGLSPISLSEMYSLAAAGNVKGLRLAVQRGMNIDARDRNGNTALCHAVYKNNFRAYNTLRAAGANPKHPCMSAIHPHTYSSFMSSGRIVPLGQIPVETYEGYAAGDFVLQPGKMVVGGAAIAAAAYFLTKGGGGGKKSSPYSNLVQDKNLAEIVGSKEPSVLQGGYKGSIIRSANGQDILHATYINHTNYDNFDETEIDNDSSYKAGTQLTRLVELINFNDYILNYAPYLEVFLKSTNGGEVYNGDVAPATGVDADEPYVNIGNNVVGIAAYENSYGENNGVLHIRAQNGSFGMLASKNSSIANNGRINISLTDQTSTGTPHQSIQNTNNQINAMYADTKSSATNNGLIDGVTTINGKSIAMQARVINQEDYANLDPVNRKPSVSLINGTDGMIQLKITAEGNVTLNSQLVGMGSFFDKYFLDARFRFSRAAYTSLSNNGTINLILSTVDETYNPNGVYDFSANDIRDGVSGIMGMRADANTTATNEAGAEIILDLKYAPLTTAPSDTSWSGSQAGMVAVHGGQIINHGTIKLEGSRGGYGMLGARGLGINAEIDLRHPYVYNSATGLIDVYSEEAFAMLSIFESFNKNGETDALVNDGTIKLNGSGSTGMSIDQGLVVNNATIKAKEGDIGMGTYKHTKYAGKSTYTNSPTGKITVDGGTGISVAQDKGFNEGKIIVSDGFGMATTGSGTITNVQDDDGVAATADPGGYIEVSGGTGMASSNSGNAINNGNTLGVNISSSDTSTETEDQNTGNKTITKTITITAALKGNTGILVNGPGGTGMSASDSTANNNGSIIIYPGLFNVELITTTIKDITDTVLSTNTDIIVDGVLIGDTAGMKESNNGAIYNNGYIQAIGVMESYGMQVSGGLGQNNGFIEILGTENIGMSSDGGKITNNGIGVINFISLPGYTSSGNIGMQTASGTATNRGTIQFGILTDPSGAGDIGMAVTNSAGTATNYGQLLFTGNSSTGMCSLGSDGTCSEGDGNLVNRGLIYFATGTTGSIGMQTDSGNATNASNATIEITGSGTGMSTGGSASLTNAGTITLGSGTGMRADGAAALMNKGSITFDSLTSSSIGMEGYNGATLTNDFDATITINGNGTGMRAVDSTATNNGKITLGSGTGMSASGESTITNNGVIDITGTGTGMWASGEDATIVNNGSITINGSSTIPACDPDGTEDEDKVGCGNFIVVSGGAKYTNSGMTTSSFSMNLNSFAADGGIVELGKGGTFEAPDISGNIQAGASIVQDGFDTEYVNENSFMGEDSGIFLYSASAMFDAYLDKNENGGYDVVMKMKDFDDVIDNSEVAGFLALNYDEGNNEALFNQVKAMGSLYSLNRAVAHDLALDFNPVFAKQNMDVLKSLNLKLNDSLFNDNNPKEVRQMAGIDHYFRNSDGQGVFQGYDDRATSIYLMGDRKISESFRAGAGLSLTKFDGEYEGRSTREEVIVQLLAPMTYQFDESLQLVSVPRIGMGFGNYERWDNLGKHKADTQNAYYGLTNELRKAFDLGVVEIEPTAEFNLLGMRQGRTKEKGGVTAEATNHFSAETGFGLYAKKEFPFQSLHRVKLRAGGTYYHEFANAFQAAKARMSGMSGTYHMDGYDVDRDRAVASIRMDYEYDAISAYLQVSKFFEGANAYSYDAGLGVKF